MLFCTKCFRTCITKVTCQLISGRVSWYLDRQQKLGKHSLPVMPSVVLCWLPFARSRRAIKPSICQMNKGNHPRQSLHRLK
jgi:hypothetical protein